MARDKFAINVEINLERIIVTKEPNPKFTINMPPMTQGHKSQTWPIMNSAHKQQALNFLKALKAVVPSPECMKCEMLEDGTFAITYPDPPEALWAFAHALQVGWRVAMEYVVEGSADATMKNRAAVLLDMYKEPLAA